MRIVVSNTYFVVFLFCFSSSCVSYVWIVHFWLPLKLLFHFIIFQMNRFNTTQENIILTSFFYFCRKSFCKLYLSQFLHYLSTYFIYTSTMTLHYIIYFRRINADVISLLEKLTRRNCVFLKPILIIHGYIKVISFKTS